MQSQEETQMKDILNLIDTWLEYQVSMHNFPGMSIGIVKNDKLIFKGFYGYSNLKKHIQANENTNYQIASMSKMFTAIAIMQLVEKRQLKLNDKVNKHLDWFKSHSITIKNLLTHSSGLIRDGNTSHWTGDESFPKIDQIKKAFSKDFILPDYINKFKYSNLGFAVLGQIIEKVSGQNYESYIKQNILNKLEMNNTFVDLPTNRKNFATGYYRKTLAHQKEVPQIKTNVLTSATGIFSNIQDLSKLAIAQINEEKSILHPLSYREMRKVHCIRKEQGGNYGLGYRLWDNDKIKVYGHGGAFQGFSSALGINSEHKLGVIVLINSTSTPAQHYMLTIIKTILNLMEKYKNLPKVESGNKYQGTYTQSWTEIEVINVNNGLIITYPSDSDPLSSLIILKNIGKDKFKIVKAGNFDYIGENVEFFFDKKNKVKLLKFGPNILRPFKSK